MFAQCVETHMDGGLGGFGKVEISCDALGLECTRLAWGVHHGDPRTCGCLRVATGKPKRVFIAGAAFIREVLDRRRKHRLPHHLPTVHSSVAAPARQRRHV